MKFSPGTRLASLYFAVQGVLGSVWWIALWAFPGIRGPFIPDGFSQGHLFAIAVPDVAFFVVGSFMASLLLHFRHRHARFVMTAVCGAIGYAALLCVGFLIGDPGYAAPALLMAASFVCTGACAVLCDPLGPELPVMPFREYEGNPRFALIHTLVQSAVFWVVFLILIPVPIAWVEQQLNWRVLPSMRASGTVLFVVAGSVGLWSGYTMARVGRGTPIPTASAPNLVIAGPYQLIRNPMAVAGLAQGIAVGLWLGSWMVWLYVVIGGLLWHTTIRPAEEEDLHRRFGGDYEQYRHTVRCWVPRLTVVRS